MIPAVLMARGFKFSFPALEGALRDALGELG
jgi:NAD dependent epimerase/dehydratase family enzyme